MEDVSHKLHDALKVIMDIHEGQKALIIHDEHAKEVSLLTKKALELEGIKVFTYKLPEDKRPLKDTPEDLRALISRLKPDLFFNQLRGIAEETPFRIALHHEESQFGAKVGHSPGVEMGMFEHPMTADFRAMKVKAEALMKKFEDVKAVRLTTAAGTDLSFSIEGRAFNDDISIRPGHMGNLPAGEMWCAPVEGSMNGTIVVDGSIGDLGQVAEPLTIRVKDGFVVEVNSKDKALVKRVKELIGVDREASLAGEFGIGLNPGARLTGNLLEDEKAARTLHIAFGNNRDMPGGQNNSITHRDFLFKAPSIITDTGKVLMKDGEFLDL
jgi:leucyl aminopeptidase (aminopeptidase T)